MEIPLRAKYRDPSAKKQKSGHNNAGNKHASRRELPKGVREEAQKVTAACQMVLVLGPSMKRRFVRKSLLEPPAQ